MISRRVLLRNGVTAGALAGIAAVAVPDKPAAASFAAQPDPIFAEIERHRAALQHFEDSIDFSDPHGDWSAEDNAEREAWNSFAETHPTTLAGVAAMAAYALHSPTAEEEDNLREVMRTIAAMTAKLAEVERRASS